jgi:hypothetical protein
VLSGTSWAEHIWEQFENLMGTHWEQGKKTTNPSPPAPSKNRKLDHSWVHSEPSHWLHEISFSKTVHRHDLPMLIAGAEFWGPYLFRWGASQVLIFILFCAQANFISPSLKKNETMEASQNRRFYFEAKNSTTFAKAHGINWSAMENMLGNTLRTWGT